MLIISKQVKYWKSLSKFELIVVIFVLLGALIKFLNFLLGGV